MDFKQEALSRCILNLEVPVSQGKVVKVQMGSFDRSNVQGNRGSHNLVLADLN